MKRDEPTSQTTLARHSREGGSPVTLLLRQEQSRWIPAFAGMASRSWSFCVAVLLSLTLLFLAVPVVAAMRAKTPVTPVVYLDVKEETRFHALTSTLRCVMCQNESLADSQAQIAHDLRREILELMRQGKSDAQIRDFLVARYGEFVLYKPRIEPATWLLWFGPLALFVAGGATVLVIVRRRAMRLRALSPAPAAPLESSEDW